MRSRTLLILIMVLAIALTGCGTERPQTPDAAKQAYLIANQVHPANAGNLLGTPPATPAPGGSVDPVGSSVDPLSSGSSLGGNASASSDPLTRTPGVSDSSNPDSPLKMRYFLGGGVSNGTADFSVNGIPIGRFSNGVFIEITQFCNFGANTISITTTPYDGSVPVTGPMKVMSNSAIPNTPPVIEFNISPTASDDSEPAPQMPLEKPKAPTIPVPVPSSTPDSSSTNGPAPRSVTFIAT